MNPSYAQDTEAPGGGGRAGRDASGEGERQAGGPVAGAAALDRRLGSAQLERMSEGRHEEEVYKRARERVEELQGFYAHLLAYVVVNLGLFLIDALTGGGWWFYWPLLGWGIGLVIHAVVVFLGGPWGTEWEERKVRQLVEKERSRRGPRPPQHQAP